jgi:hypothetical protein
VDHDTALKTLAAERYTLDEMSDDEAGAFEEHFFECRECAQDVRDTVTFAENVKALDREWEPVGARREETGAGHAASARGPASRPAAASWRSSRTYLPAAAALAFLAVAVYQAAVVIPRLERFSAPRAAEPTVLRVVRAAPTVVVVERDQPTFELVVDVGVTSSGYRLQFVDAGDEPVAIVEAKAPESGTLLVMLPVASFPAGDYTMLLRASDGGGAPGKAIEEYRFRVETSR